MVRVYKELPEGIEKYEFEIDDLIVEVLNITNSNVENKDIIVSRKEE